MCFLYHNRLLVGNGKSLGGMVDEFSSIPYEVIHRYGSDKQGRLSEISNVENVKPKMKEKTRPTGYSRDDGYDT